MYGKNGDSKYASRATAVRSAADRSARLMAGKLQYTLFITCSVRRFRHCDRKRRKRLPCNGRCASHGQSLINSKNKNLMFSAEVRTLFAEWAAITRTRVLLFFRSNEMRTAEDVLRWDRGHLDWRYAIVLGVRRPNAFRRRALFRGEKSLLFFQPLFAA